MALRECPECGGSVSSHARSCPHCGCGWHNMLDGDTKLLIGIVIFTCALIIGMWLNQQTSLTPS
jgi:hypothetical protein